MYQNSSLVGNIGEAVAISEFTKCGFGILMPLGSNLPYDLVIDVNGKLYKIQCKTSSKKHDEDSMLFHTCRTNGFTCEHQTYENNEIDFFFLYCIENDYKALISVNKVKSSKIKLRLSKPKNNQKIGIYMAEDYVFDKQIEKLKTDN